MFKHEGASHNIEPLFRELGRFGHQSMELNFMRSPGTRFIDSKFKHSPLCFVFHFRLNFLIRLITLIEQFKTFVIILQLDRAGVGVSTLFVELDSLIGLGDHVDSGFGVAVGVDVPLLHSLSHINPPSRVPWGF